MTIFSLSKRYPELSVLGATPKSIWFMYMDTRSAHSANRSSSPVVKAPPAKRIEYLKERVGIMDVAEHFGHRARPYGNSLCPFHDERNPSSRFYPEQNTFWCWVCSPNHGVDIVEYVILALGLVHEAPAAYSEKTRHSWATLRALDYLEEEFGISYEQEPWEARLNNALSPFKKRSHVSTVQFWNDRHCELLLLMLQIRDARKWVLYSELLQILGPVKYLQPPHQIRSWQLARQSMLNIAPP